MRRSERATGLLSTAFGVGVVLGLVAVCANVAIGLWIRTTVESVGMDAASRVAEAPEGADLVALADRAAGEARRLLGREGDRTGLEWRTLGPDTVVLRITHPGVALAPRFLDRRPVFGRTDRTVVVRREGHR